MQALIEFTQSKESKVIEFTPPAVVSAQILQNLASSEGEMPVAVLKQEISQAATDRGFSAQTAVQALYALVANGLVEINRTASEATIKLS